MDPTLEYHFPCRGHSFCKSPREFKDKLNPLYPNMLAASGALLMSSDVKHAGDGPVKLVVHKVSTADRREVMIIYATALYLRLV
jgi:hypothetical protein